MNYWLYLAGKLGAGAAVMSALWKLLTLVMPPPGPLPPNRTHWFAQDLGWTTVALVYTLVGFGLLKLIIWDQRYRCRTCLRWLRMPLEKGSWTRMLMSGSPRIEYICPYGHGTLKIPEVQISGPEPPDWQPSEDMWKELASLEESHK